MAALVAGPGSVSKMRVVTKLLVRAFEKSQTLDIAPPVFRTSFTDAVTEFSPGEYMLWYNTPDHSTHVVKLQASELVVAK